jgi:hypothetical protein
MGLGYKAAAVNSGAAPMQRALVPVAPARPADAAPSRPVRANSRAAFLTHLIATVQGAPQTRERRRADPKQAITTYSACAAMIRIPASAGWPIHECRS